MSKILSFFGFGGKDSSRPDSLAAARDLIAGAPERDMDDIVALARKKLKKYPDIAGDIAWLHTHEHRHTDDNGAMVLLAMLLDKLVFSPSQIQRSAKAAAAELEKALRDKSVPDDVKITIPPLLLLTGRPADEESVRGFFQDYETAAQKYSLGFAKSVSDSPDSLTMLLQATGFTSGDGDILAAYVPREPASELLAFGHGVAGVNPAAATLMTAALMFRVGAPDFSHEQSPEQLGDIHALATSRARWCLETLANWPGFAMPFRERAAHLAAELASRGIKSQTPLAPGEFSHGMISMIDGMGSRTATLFHRTPEGGFDAINVMLNDEVGVKDAYGYFRNGSELEELLRDNPEQMQIANASLSLIRELLADAFALHDELRTAPPGRLFPLMAYLGDEPIKARKREPNLGAYMLETVRPTPELVNGVIDLTNNPLFGVLFPASDAAYAFCEKHMGKRRKVFDIGKLPDFVKEIMPLERERLLRRMAINLEIEALAGRAGRKDNQAAARLWLGMKENVMPFELIPFVQELAGMAASRITLDIRSGYRNQREAFAAEERGEDGWDKVPGAPLEMPGLDKIPKAEREAVLSALIRKLYGDADFPDFPPPEFLATVSGRKPGPRGKAKTGKRSAKGGWVYAGPPGVKAKPSSPKSAGIARNRRIYRLAVEIIDCPPMAEDFMRANPGIVREIEIAGDQSLDKLHLAIFKAFDREDMHGYEFQLSDKRMESGVPRYTHPQALADDPDNDLLRDAAANTLDGLDLAIGQKFLYWFDFGDDWWHGIAVKEIGSPVPRRKYPRMAAKYGVSPPQYAEK